jgi:protein ImuB
VLWTCLYFPDLPLSVFARADAQESPTVVSSASHRPDVLVANDAAKQRGIVAGLSIAAALALDSEITIRLRDECAEAEALQNIALWAGQWTSTISIEPPAGVLLEVSACLNYFGGLESLLDRIDSGLAEIGFPGVIATAPTAGAASLLARAGRAIAIQEREALEREVGALPVELLWGQTLFINATLASQNKWGLTSTTLAGIGVRTIGELLALPREGIARRFGQSLLDEIDRARGMLPDARPMFVAPERYHGQIELPSPVDDAEALLFALKRLVVELAGFLRGRGAGVTRLICDLVHEDAKPTSIVLGLSSTRQAEHILNVLRERLSREQLPDRVEAIRLISEEISPLRIREGDFFPGADRNTEAGAQLVERLRARLGENAVRSLGLHADHRPEEAWRFKSDAAAGATHPPSRPLRPLWLLPEPRALEGEPAAEEMKLLSGPERIETGWWDGEEIGRDYFVGRDVKGSELWLYRDRGGRWFVHGVFA